MTLRYQVRVTPSELALGAARLGAFWKGDSPRSALHTVETALELGINVLDTADVYALGLSERIIGALARHKRERLLLCTKVGQLKTPLATLRAHAMQRKLSLASFAAAIPRRTPSDVELVPRCYESAYLEYAFRASLRRLRSERVDMLLLHSPSLRDLEARRFEAAALRMLDRGQAMNFGVSCDTAEVARAAAKLSYVSFIELPVDVLASEQRALATELSALGIGVLARSPFGGGELSRYFAEKLGRFDADTQAYCLQTVVKTPGVFSTVVGMGSAERVRENVALLRRPVASDKRAQIERLLPSANDEARATGTTR
ncbi:MAG: putative oxidoreductase, aryl-alcohol dehydrogenase like protein [Myxococcaceae bacterium]|nr:putative oxidoreductase, aryl-alcohol dehydrogenase like protein [Myxococcaceae bacterium]